MSTSFQHSANGLVLGNTRTLIYGPVGSGTVGVVFAGTFSNVDDTNQVQHNFKVERFDGVTYQVELNHIPIEYGGSSKCPKITLLAGESLYGTADVASCVAASVHVFVRPQ